MIRINEYGQPVGASLEGWEPPDPPPVRSLAGRTVRLDPLNSSTHAQPLFESFREAPDSLWTYMPFGPFGDIDHLRAAIDQIVALADWQPYAIVVDRAALGFLSYLRINPPDGVIEIGSIAFSTTLQRTTAATEAVYLLLANAFELGYRRCEWKCDDMNAPSRVAAHRLGFRFEGTFLNATHYKGRNRDTAWYAITDAEWPALDAAFHAWLAADNFDADGRQQRSLGDLRTGHGGQSE